MPRPSADSLLTQPAIDVRHIRLQPGPELTPSQARAFAEIVATMPPVAFRESDRVMLNQLILALDVAAHIARDLDGQPLVVEGLAGPKPNPLVAMQREQQRLVMSLLTKLRLTPQTRRAPENAPTVSTPDHEVSLARAVRLARESRA